jgi:flagellar hook-basal body complex protein FliE
MKTQAINGAFPSPQQVLARMNQGAKGLQGVDAGPDLARRLQGGRVEGPAFSDYLADQVNSVNQTMLNADQRVADVSTGRSRNLHEMMIELNKADLSLRMLTQVRNKALEAYQELMRMSL